MIHIAICDNDYSVLDNLENKISNILNSQVRISKHNNPFSLMTYIMDEVKGNIDLVIIDIRLQSQNGIYVAETLLEEYPNIKIIFTSEKLELVKDIFRINPVYFLLKPIDENYLRDALYKVIKIVDDESTDILWLGSANGKGRLSSIKTRNIYYIESDKRQVHIHFIDSTKTYYAKLDDIEHELKQNFIRCHQSYIVNMDKIKQITKDRICLYNDMNVAISRSKNKDVIEKINKYMKLI